MSEDRKQVKLEPRYGHFLPAGLAITTTKVLIIQGLVLSVSSKCPSKEEMEELVKSYKLATTKKVVKRVGTGIINASIKLSVQRELELWLKPRVDLRILRKLTKSTSASAVRKAEKHGRVYAVGHIGFTAAWGCLLSNAAVFVAEETMLAWITLWRRLRKQRKKLQGKDTGDQHLPRVLRVSHQRHSFLEVTLDNLWRCLAGVYCEAAGAVVGTAIAPGLGTVIGQTIFSLLPWVI